MSRFICFCFSHFFPPLNLFSWRVEPLEGKFKVARWWVKNSHRSNFLLDFQFSTICRVAANEVRTGIGFFSRYQKYFRCQSSRWKSKMKFFHFMQTESRVELKESTGRRFYANIVSFFLNLNCFSFAGYGKICAVFENHPHYLCIFSIICFNIKAFGCTVFFFFYKFNTRNGKMLRWSSNLTVQPFFFIDYNQAEILTYE